MASSSLVRMQHIFVTWPPVTNMSHCRSHHVTTSPRARLGTVVPQYCTVQYCTVLPQRFTFHTYVEHCEDVTELTICPTAGHPTPHRQHGHAQVQYCPRGSHSTHQAMSHNASPSLPLNHGQFL